MATHPTYPQQGPGPSSYYQQPQPPLPPPPHHVYGSHSPGPRPNYYPYAPHMNSHQPSHYHHPPPPSNRGNHRGGGNMNGSYNSRGTHHYHHNHNHHHGYHPQNPYSPHVYPQQHYQSPAPKYNQPYSPASPAYSGYPSVTAPVFTPSWQTQPQHQQPIPISPLPKQLSMPPPQNVHPGFYESQPPPPPQISVEESTQAPATEPDPVPEPEETKIETQHTFVHVPSSPSPESSSPTHPRQPTPPPSDEQAPIPTSTSSYSQMGSISAAESSDVMGSTSTVSTSESAASDLPSSGSHHNAKWAIWSRRPQDPAHAPGIIISPRARPPPDVVQQALDMKTPPASVPSSPSIAKKPLPEAERQVPVALKEAMSPSLSLDTLNSSSVTETSVSTAATPTISGSPASSHTSLSASVVAMSQVQKEVVILEAKLAADSKPAVTESATSGPAPQSVEEKAEPPVATTPTPVAPKTEMLASPQPAVAPTLPPSTDVPVPASPAQSATSSTALAPPSQAAAAAPKPAAPPVKKSWASLLRPASSAASPGAPAATRNALPTSSVVGFSIPAASEAASAPVPVSAGKKNELLTLLTRGPAAPATPSYASAGMASSPSSTLLKIRPRGLINSGNMCFANSVLQILVYCPPFHHLFVELGKLLVGGVGPTAGGASGSSGTSTPNGTGKDIKDSATPLVDATVEFLKEFVEDKKSKAMKDRAKAKNVYIDIGANGAAVSGSGRGKGKEREVLNEDEEPERDQDDWDGDSFLPTGVYDAMKVKKRFEGMGNGHQEDAEEFLGFYLDTLEEELLSILHSINPPKQNKNAPGPGAHVEEKEEAAAPEDDGWLEVGKKNKSVITRTIKTTESPISRIFGGKFRTTLRAPGQKDSVIVEDWQSLRLDIQREQIHTIQDALTYISHPQTVQMVKAGVTTDAHQQVLIEALPPVLVLHIKRFYYDTTANGVVKISKQVRFGPELEVGADVMVPAAKKTHPVRYKLFGAIYHHGLSASGGHYTLDVLHPNRYPSANPAAKPREGWVRIDDNLVSDVRNEDVFEASERDESRCAYLLFYRRV
ncbi:cysteine proteinase [Agrocybe pediades]|nr:cysteine proteinase [Agrocybe pediades]